MTAPLRTCTDYTRTACQVIVGESINCPDRWDRLRVTEVDSTGRGTIRLAGYLRSSGATHDYTFKVDDRVVIHGWLNEHDVNTVPGVIL